MDGIVAGFPDRYELADAGSHLSGGIRESAEVPTIVVCFGSAKNLLGSTLAHRLIGQQTGAHVHRATRSHR